MIMDIIITEIRLKTIANLTSDIIIEFIKNINAINNSTIGYRIEIWELQHLDLPFKIK